MSFSGAGCSPWICLKTSIGDLLGSIFFAASANASGSAFNCAIPISRIFSGGRSTSSVWARKRVNLSSPSAQSSDACGSFPRSSQAANAIVERRKISFDINIHIACARIDHRISLEDRHVLHLKKILLHCGLKNSQIDGLAGTQFGRIEFGQYVVEPSQPVKLRVEREPAVIGYFAVVFMKAESSSLERVGSEVGVDVIHGARFELRVVCLCSEGRRPKPE